MRSRRRLRYFHLPCFIISFGIVLAGTTATPSAGESASVGSDFLALPAYDAEISAEKGSKVMIGDDVRFVIPGLPASSGPLEVALPPDQGSFTDDGWVLEDAATKAAGATSFIASPVKSGELTLPSLALVDAEGKPVARTHPVAVRVHSSIDPNDAESQKQVEALGPVGLAFPLWLAVGAGALALALVIAAIWGAVLLLKCYRPKRVPLPAAPPRPEDEVALSELADLELLGFMARGQFKKHYFRASEILKNYVGARYGFDAPESTSREILDRLERDSGLSRDRLSEIDRMFTRMDPVKFADQVPSVAEASELSSAIREWVLRTRRPRTQVLPQGGPGAL